MKTYSAKPSEVVKKWILIDADGVVLGRLASIVRSSTGYAAECQDDCN